MKIEHLHVENHLLNCSRKSTWCIDFGNFSSFSPWPSLLLVHPGMINWSFSAATRRQRSKAARTHLLLLVLLLLLFLHHLEQHHRVLEAAILRHLLWHGVPHHHLYILSVRYILLYFLSKSSATFILCMLSSALYGVHSVASPWFRRNINGCKEINFKCNSHILSYSRSSWWPGPWETIWFPRWRMTCRVSGDCSLSVLWSLLLSSPGDKRSQTEKIALEWNSEIFAKFTLHIFSQLPSTTTTLCARRNWRTDIW